MKIATPFPKTGLCLYLFGIVLLLGCSEEPPQPDPEVLFEASASAIEVGESVTYTNLSSSVFNALNWTFEGGNPATSIEPNPTVTYVEPGSFDVTLKASNDELEMTIREEEFVTVSCAVMFCDPVFANYDKIENVVYGINPDFHFLEVYEPRGDESDSRPLVILFPGGGFDSQSELSKLQPVAEELVQYGIVVAVGRYRDNPAEAGVEFLSAMIMANQDVRASVRYFRSEAATWRINPEQIFIGGHSSGAISTLFAAYTTQSEIASAQQSIFESVGGLEGGQGHSEYSSEVAGIISLAGEIYDLTDTPTLVDSGEPPIFAVHGEDDTEIRIGTSQTPGGAYAFGSIPIISRADEQGILNGLYIFENGNHSMPRERPDLYIGRLMAFVREIIL